MDTFVIAEAGANHNRNFNQALSLIDVAVKSKATACKFQTYTADKLFTTKSKKVNGFDVLDMFKNIELPRDWQYDLKQYCDEKDIEFMSTPFDEEAVDELFKLGVKRFKIAGFESTDLRFIQYVASTQLPIIISAGIGTDINFIEKILESCYKVDCKDVTILHCNNGYPTQVCETNLLTIPQIKKKYNIKVGYSDHTLDTLTPSLAVALGAEVIEKHFTLSKSLPGPDHSFALEPHQLKEMINNIKHTEKTLNFKTTLTKSEKDNWQGQRSIILKRNVKKGEKVNADTITTKRPFYPSSIHAKDYLDLVEKNCIFTQDLNKDDFLEWKQITN
jgi:sialic acid synthase SpsE